MAFSVPDSLLDVANTVRGMVDIDVLIPRLTVRLPRLRCYLDIYGM